MRTVVLDRHDRRADVAAQLGTSFVRLKRSASWPATCDHAGVLGAARRRCPYTTVVVDDLESRGLVVRQPDPEDRRRKIVAVTPAGRRLARQAGELLDDPPEALLELPPKDLAHLDRIMELLLNAEGSEPA